MASELLSDAPVVGGTLTAVSENTGGWIFGLLAACTPPVDHAVSARCRELLLCAAQRRAELVGWLRRAGPLVAVAVAASAEKAGSHDRTGSAMRSAGGDDESDKVGGVRAGSDILEVATAFKSELQQLNSLACVCGIVFGQKQRDEWRLA